MPLPQHGPRPPGRRSVLFAGLAAAMAPTALARPAAAAAPSAPTFTPVLPGPAGPHPVGVRQQYLTDVTRPDPWDPAIPVRELMVSVYYPANRAAGPRAPWMTAGAAEAYAFLGAALHPGLPASGVDWAGVRTHAHAGAAPTSRPVGLLVYSPGGGDPRTLGSGLAEHLAAHGWVVVTVDHPGDAAVVEFPAATSYRDTLRYTVFRGDPRADPPVFDTMIETRVADLRFVIDRARTGGLGNLVARAARRTAVYGHSAGGTAAALTADADRRIRAAVDLEGYLDRPGGELYPLTPRCPLLLVSTGSFPDMTGSWSAALTHPCVTERLLPRAAHWAFTDLAAIVPQLQAARLTSAAARDALVGPASPHVTVPAVRDLVRGGVAAGRQAG